MFNINFTRIGKELTPHFLRNSKMKQFVGVLTWGSTFAMSVLNAFRSLKQHELNFTGQRIYLEKWLNDRFDPVNAGIQVVNIQLVQNPYLFNKIEQRTQYIYNKYDAANAYFAGQFARFGLTVYECVQAGTGNQPDISPAYWQPYTSATVMRNKTELGATFSFKIIVPASITLTTELINSIETEVDKFLIAGKTYQITQ